MYIDYTFTAQELTGKVGNNHPRFLVPIDTAVPIGEGGELWPKPGSLFQLTALILFNDFVG
jgi:hypothetical protein